VTVLPIEGIRMSDTPRVEIELVRAAYAAFATGDMDAFGALYSDDVVHILPGKSRVCGNHRGPGRARLLPRTRRALRRPIRVEPETFFTDGDRRVLVIHHTTATRDGRQLDIREGIVIMISDGKITALDGFLADFDQYEAFWR
jgi:uncharacterized protein